MTNLKFARDNPAHNYLLLLFFHNFISPGYYSQTSVVDFDSAKLTLGVNFNLDLSE